MAQQTVTLQSTLSDWKTTAQAAINSNFNELYAGMPGGAFTASRAIVSNGSGVLTASATTATEIGYISGVTSAIQTQLNGKQPLATGTPDGTKFLRDDNTWQPVSGGVTDFTDLGDVPASYASQALKVVRVNAGETGLEFATVSGTGDVVGPASSTDNNIALFDGVSGKLIKDSGTLLSAKENTISAGTTGQYWRGDKTWQTLDKTAVGLGNVDNTSDAAKLLAAWPVGSIYISVNSTNPGTFFGGTWIAFATGRTIVGIDAGQTEFDTVEEIGGSKTHTLSDAEIPSHNHSVTDPGHNHTQNAHNHAVTDPGHNHTQNAHNHGLTDPGHTHVQGVNSATTGAISGYTPDTSTNTRVNSGYSTSSSTTGATVDNATATNQSNTTGLTVNNATPTNNSNTTGISLGNTGGGGSHNNLQPYIVVYMFKRTA